MIYGIRWLSEGTDIQPGYSMSACVWSAFPANVANLRWATIAPNGTIVLLRNDGHGGRWEAEFTSPNGANCIMRLGTSEEDALRDAAELAESI